MVWVLVEINKLRVWSAGCTLLLISTAKTGLNNVALHALLQRQCAAGVHIRTQR